MIWQVCAVAGLWVAASLMLASAAYQVALGRGVGSTRAGSYSSGVLLVLLAVVPLAAVVVLSIRIGGAL